MTKKKQAILVASLIAALILLVVVFGYQEVSDTRKITKLETQIAQKEVRISNLEADLVKQGLISDSLLVVAGLKDSIIAVKEAELIDIRNKYNHMKHEVQELTSEESVQFLDKQLRASPNYVESEYPKLVYYENTRIVMIDTNENKQINLTFVALAEKTEELDTTNQIVILQRDEIEDLYSAIDSKDVELRTFEDLVETQDSVITDQKDLVEEKDKAIKKLNRKNKFKSAGAIIMTGVAAVGWVLFGIATI